MDFLRRRMAGMNCKRTIAAVALFWWIAAPSLFAQPLLAQDFLKQLEETILKRKEEAKAKEAEKEPKKEEGELLPSPKEVKEPKEAKEIEELPLILQPADNAPPASPAESLPRPMQTTTSRDVPPPPPTPAVPRSSPTTQPTTPALRNPPAVPSAPPASVGGGGYLGMTVESTAGGGFGLTVMQVTADSPAWKAGFRIGDKLIAIEGTAVTSVDDLAVHLAQFSPGTAVRFLVERNGKSASLTAVLQDRSLANRIRSGVPTSSEMVPGQASFGASVSDMSEGYRKQFGIAPFRGASVTEVISGSPADQIGLRPGDCIVSIQGNEVSKASQVLDAISIAKPGQVVEVGYYRGTIQHRGSAVLLRKDNVASPTWDDGAVTPEMLTPEYVSALQTELDRVSNELLRARERMRQLENRLKQLEAGR